jgi:hypothetical protein
MRSNHFWLTLIVFILPPGSPTRADVTLSSAASSVKQYELIEFTIEPGALYQHPFDPDEADLHLVIQTPDNRVLQLPAFQMQPYEQQRFARSGKPALWLYPQGHPVWRARFAPSLPGTYTVIAEVVDAAGSRQSAPATFTCAAADHRGFVRVSQRDPRYFEFTTGEPFFPIGQNLAFIGDSQFVTPATVQDTIEKLARNGVNYLRIWTCCHDWALAVEARKSAWGRSWNWHPPFTTRPDQENGQRQCVVMNAQTRKSLEVTPTHPVAVRPNTDYVLTGQVRLDPEALFQIRVGRHVLPQPLQLSTRSEWQTFHIPFTTGADEWWLEPLALAATGKGSVWIDALSLRDAADGPELLWEADVNRPERGYYNPIDCAQLDLIVESARQNGIYLQLCLLTRDAYMQDLKDDSSEAYQQAITDAQHLLRYAVARWGYSTSVATWEYFNENDPGLPIERFHREVGEYLRKVDIYGHLRSTSTWHPSARDCRDPHLDVADMHFYLRPVPDRQYSNEVDAVAGNAAWLREQAPARPALLGEFGLADPQWRETREMRESPEIVDFHNALWASALSGTSGTALYWWWDRLDPRNHVEHYRPLANYLAGIPWNTAALTPTSATISDKSVRIVGLQGKDRAYCWLFDPHASWDSIVIEHRSPAPHAQTTLEVTGLSPGAYCIEWWDTRTGQVIEQRHLSTDDGQLQLEAPVWQRDVALKVFHSVNSPHSAAGSPAGRDGTSPPPSAASQPVRPGSTTPGAD